MGIALPGPQSLDLVETGSGHFYALLLPAREAFVLGVVRAHERRACQSALDGCAIHDHSVLHIVAVLAHDGYDEVLAAWPFVEVGRLHRTGTHDGLLRVVHDVSACVGTESEVGTGQAQALLDHRRPAGDAGRRVVLWVWDQGSAHSQNELGVYLDVSVDEDGVILVLLPPESVDTLLIVIEGLTELLVDGIAVRQLDLDAQFSLGYLFLTEVQPLHLGGVDRPAVLR